MSGSPYRSKEENPLNQVRDRLFLGDAERNSQADVADQFLVDLTDRRRRQDKHVRYGVLLALSTVIATGGVITDSTATVIGAMIVAPLATPIMAMGLAIVMAAPAQLRHATQMVLLSIVVVVGLAFVIVWLMPDMVDFDDNSQVLGRTSPRVTDLMVAVATGFVGAYAACRRDVSSVLPGVAISISLVPPLAVVGVSVESARWADTWGAFVLFSANAVAMVLAAISVFLIAGYRPKHTGVRATSLKQAYLIVSMFIAVLLIPLGISTWNSVVTMNTTRAVNAEVPKWLEGTGFDYVRTDRYGKSMTIVVTGSGELPPTEPLVEGLTNELPSGTNLLLQQLNGETTDLGSIR
jgi:uncharacterized hydrophobic protein (TIGR00271 family)